MSDKVFTKKMTLSICLILLCLCALSISAGAFFTDSKNSQAKTFSTATFDLTIASKHSVLEYPNEPSNTTRKDETIGPTIDTTYRLTYNENDADSNVYNVTIAIKASSTITTSSGYCKIIITDPNNQNSVLGTYYTRQIGISDSTDAEHTVRTRRYINIDLKTIKKSVDVTFIPLWGTYSDSANAIPGLDQNTPDVITVTASA